MGVLLHVGHSASLRRQSATLDRQVANLSNVLLTDSEVEASEALKPLFDSVWNAFGYPRSMNYDDQGKWNPR